MSLVPVRIGGIQLLLPTAQGPHDPRDDLEALEQGGLLLLLGQMRWNLLLRLEGELGGRCSSLGVHHRLARGGAQAELVHVLGAQKKRMATSRFALRCHELGQEGICPMRHEESGGPLHTDR